MAAKRTLIDQGGVQLGRFGAAGVKRALADPVDVLGNEIFDYAMVRCEENDTYIVREGLNNRSCKYEVIWFEGSDEDEKPVVKEFDKVDVAVCRFIELCKREI